MTGRTRFVVIFAPASGTDGVRSLRALLKAARRCFGLVAVDVHEHAPANVANALGQLRRDVRNRLRERSS